MINRTRNQHFISQAEQRLNAINSGVSKDKQKIYSFKLIDHENNKIFLQKPIEVKIKTNLSFQDLFTFEKLDGGNRYNLEHFFQKYEENIINSTNSLMNKVSINGNKKPVGMDVKNEVLSIFSMKLINTFRNPFCIRKTLNTMEELRKYLPVTSLGKKIYNKIDNVDIPEVDNVTNRFSVTKEEYRRWIKYLYMLLANDGENKSDNLIDLIIKALFEDSKNLIKIIVYVYSGDYKNKGVLLSDRGYVLIEDDGFTDYQFNLRGDSFISYLFCDMSKKGPDIIGDEHLLSECLKINSAMERGISVTPVYNCLASLDEYNGRVVNWSYEYVYCKSENVLGLKHNEL